MDYNIVKEFCDLCLFSANGFRYIIYNDIQRCFCYRRFKETTVASYLHAKGDAYERLYNQMYSEIDACSWLASETFQYNVNGHQMLFYNRAIVPNIYISLDCIYSCRLCHSTRDVSDLYHLYEKQTFEDIVKDIACHTEEEESMRFMNWFSKK